MKVQTDHLMSEMMRVQIDHSDITVIAVSLISSEFLDSEKRAVEKKLTSSLKNSFLTDSLASHLSVFSVILMIQTSAFSEALLSDSSEFSSLISAFPFSSIREY